MLSLTPLKNITLANSNNMLTKKEAAKARAVNYGRIKEILRCALCLGINLSKPTRLRGSLRILTLFLLICGAISVYGHWNLVKDHIDNIPAVAESICTAFQIILAMIKIIYSVINQRRFYEMLELVVNSTMLQKIEIFEQDYQINEKLKREIDDIMNGVWKEMRVQLMFYLTSCACIMSLYFFPPILINYYHKLKETPNYVYLSPFASRIWDDKGMTFPYYHIHLFLDGCGIYMCGICAVAFDGIFIVLTLHAIGLIKVLNFMVLRSTSELVSKEGRVDYLRYCIRHYQRISIFTSDTHSMFMHVSLWQFILTLLAIGLILFKMNIALEIDTITFIRMVFYLCADSTMSVIYCYNGQQLTSTSEETPQAFYSCLWYNENEEFQELVKMMIQRTNKDFHFNVSWFAPMNLATLIAIFEMSISYFLLLRDLSD